MAYIIESSAQALTSAGVRENYSLFLEQDGKQNRLSIQSNEGLLFKDGLNVSYVFPLNLDLLPGLLMYIQSLTAPTRLQTPVSVLDTWLI